MTQVDFIRLMSTKTGHTNKTIKEVLDGLGDALFEVVTQEDQVVLGHAVKVSGVRKAPRNARNPITGETVPVPERVAPAVKTTPSFRKAVYAVTEKKD